MRIQIQLASGGDERVSAKTLFYIREMTAREAEENPGATCLLRLSSGPMFPLNAASELAAEFAEVVQIVSATLPNDTVALLNADAVIDHDDVPSTVAPNATSWLVFGTGARAPRLAIVENKTQLASVWADAGLATTLFS